MTKMARQHKKPNDTKDRPTKPLEDKLSKVLTTDRQKKFLRNRLAGMNKRQAAIQAGYSPSTASDMAKRLTDKLACNQAFLEEMHRQGLTIEAVVGEIKRGVTEAMHPQFPDQPDNFNRRAFTDMAVKIYGGYAPSKLDMKMEKREVKLVITPDVVERIKKADKIIAEDDDPEDSMLLP